MMKKAAPYIVIAILSALVGLLPIFTTTESRSDYCQDAGIACGARVIMPNETIERKTRGFPLAYYQSYESEIQDEKYVPLNAILNVLLWASVFYFVYKLYLINQQRKA